MSGENRQESAGTERWLNKIDDSTWTYQPEGDIPWTITVSRDVLYKGDDWYRAEYEKEDGGVCWREYPSLEQALRGCNDFFKHKEKTT